MIRVTLNAVTSTERQSVIDAVREAVGRADGWIDDVNFFSNVAISIRATVASQLASIFGRELVAIGLKFDEGQLLLLNEAEGRPSQELSCFLQITFFHNEPDLRRHVPSVPG